MRVTLELGTFFENTQRRPAGDRRHLDEKLIRNAANVGGIVGKIADAVSLAERSYGSLTALLLLDRHEPNDYSVQDKGVKKYV